MLKIFSVCAFLFLPLVFAPSAFAQTTPQQPATNSAPLHTAGQVVWVKGTVRAIYPEQSPRVLARGALIYNQDTLVTDTTSSIEIAFTDNSILSLRPGTTFVIEHYQFDQAKPSSGSFVMNVIEGGFRTITGFVAKSQPDNYQVKVPVATIGVRGTSYQANCKNNQCAVGLEKGTGVSVSNLGGTVVLTPKTPFAVIVSPTVKPALSNQEPAILARPPDVTPSAAPPPPGVNPVGVSGNCGIIIN